jgi:predicted dehydrogenase
MGTKTTYRAALVGCGRMSRYHAEALQSIKNVKLVALADINETNLHRVGVRFRVDGLYLDYQELLEREQPDLLAICTQAPQHAPITLAAAATGVKGILCEKPIALTLEGADAMIAACQKSGTRLAINHQTRMIPNTFVVEQLLEEGTIGELRAARIIDKGLRPAGNSLFEMCTHLFDWLRIYAGDPEWVSGHLTVGDSEGHQRRATVADIQYSRSAWPKDRDCGLVLGDRCTATFGFGPREGWHKGITATLESYFQIPREGRSRPSIELIGTDGMLFLGGAGDRVDVYLHRGPWMPPGHLEPMGETFSTTDGENATVVLIAAMVEELVAAIENEREHRSSGRDGRWALEMIMGIFESHRREGARVELPLKYRGHPLQRWLEEARYPLPPKPEQRA